MVEEVEALPSKERKGGRTGGSLHFKGDDDCSAASRFRESAYDRMVEATLRQEAASSADAASAQEAASGKHVFSSSAAKGKKRKHDKVGASTLKNTKLLSFDNDEDD